MAIFEGSAVALVLPMFDNGDIDFEGFKRQRHHHHSHHTLPGRSRNAVPQYRHYSAR